MTALQLLDLYILLLNTFMFLARLLRRNIARFLLSFLVFQIIFWFKQDALLWNRFCFIFLTRNITIISKMFKIMTDFDASNVLGLIVFPWCFWKTVNLNFYTYYLICVDPQLFKGPVNLALCVHLSAVTFSQKRLMAFF